MVGDRARHALLAAVLLFACGDDDSRFPICLTSGVVAEIAVSTPINRLDVLFVIDDGPSMAGAQPVLQARLSDLISRLAEANRAAGRTALDLHVGVASADMGSGSAEWPGCDAVGDDGLLQRADCGDDAPAFLSFEPPGAASHPLFAFDAGTFEPPAAFTCRAALGADGCDFAQPLEAALGALWPASYRDPQTGELAENPIEFLGDGSGAGEEGHGDGANAGFLRNDVIDGLSAIAVLVVTDSDDCSTADFGLFEPPEPERTTASARCAREDGSLYVLDRYVDGLKALRPGAEQLVHFGALAGVPLDLVSAEARAAVDFDDEGQRDAHYEALLDDPRMQPAFETSEAGVDRLEPACESELASAEPARRLVEVARRFGRNGRVHSICDDDWTPVVDSLVRELSLSSGPQCLARRLVPGHDGLVGCELVWELPPAEQAPEGTPVTCDDARFLTPAEKPLSTRGGARCVLRQLALTGTVDAAVLESGDGWFYDDLFEYDDGCGPRVVFTPDAKPPRGVVVKLECLETRYSPPPRDDLASDVAQPGVLEACEPDAPDACARVLRDSTGGERGDGLDREMVCHPTREVCVVPCEDARCPSGWRCDHDDALPHCEPGECRVPG